MTDPSNTLHAWSPNVKYEPSLAHILWMGGSPCSGKSSIARILADRHTLRTYHCDEAFGEHQKRITRDKHPTLYKWTTTTWNELWMQPVDVLLVEAIACYQEHFEMIIDDLLALPRSERVLVEGTPLLPNRVRAMLSDPSQAIWIVPTEEFLRERYPRRASWVQAILDQCKDPQRALQNWMDRDVRFADWVTRKARGLGLKLITVDGKHTIAENAERVAGHFGLQ